MGSYIDITGQHFGKLVALRKLEKKKGALLFGNASVIVEKFVKYLELI